MFRIKSLNTKAGREQAPSLKRARKDVYMPPLKKSRVVLKPLEASSLRTPFNVAPITETVFEPGGDYITEKTVAEAEEEEETMDAEETALLNQFIEVIPQLLSSILKGEAHSNIETLCSCGSGQRRYYMCRDCIQYDPSCESCWIERHQGSPLHWVHQWQPKGFYCRLNMACLHDGTHALQLGHPGGICPSPDKPQTMTIVHSNGIHGTRIRFCFCNGRPDPVDQCMKARLFPATLQAPKTFFTFQVLNEFLNHHLVSGRSAFQYLGGLRHLTDGAFTAAVQDPYKQFCRATQVWRHLCADKWSGKAFDLSQHFPHRKPDNVIVFCPCCPEDGINTEEGWEQTPEELRHLVQRQLTADDEKGDNVSLLNDCVSGYFPSRESMRQHLAIAPKTNEKSTCNYLKVVNNQDKKKFKNMSVTGIVGVQCSHVFMLSAVDLTASEGFTYTNKAIAHAFSHTRHDRDHCHYGSCDDCLAYDCNCQYCVNMRPRFEKTCPELLHIVNHLRFAIGPMHLPDHKDECMFLFSAAYMICIGQFNGDSGKQVWASLNAFGPATRQMNNGHRQDVISGWLLYWNWLKAIGMAQRLSINMVDAREQLKVSQATAVPLSVLYSAQIPEWKALEEDHNRRKATPGQSPPPSLYQHNVDSIPSRTAIYCQILTKEDKTDSKPTARSKMAAFLIEALNIKHAQRRIKGKLTLNQTETVKHDIEGRQEQAKVRLKSLRNLQGEVMPATEADVVAQPACEIENKEIFVPSSYTEAQRKEKGLEALAEIERTLREGELYDAIEEVRQAAKNQSIVRDQKAKNNQGTRANTRLLLQLKTIYVELQCCISDYNCARQSLQALGGGSDLPEMKEEDTYRKSTVHKRGLGDSRRTDGQLYTLNMLSSPGMKEHIRTEGPSGDRQAAGTQVVCRKRGPKKNKKKTKKRGSDKKVMEDGWIWQSKVLFTRIDLSSQKQLAYDKECDRVQWFRARAERDRWQERIKTAWDTAASSAESFGHQAYARRQASMFKRLQTDAEVLLAELGIELELPPGEILVDRVAWDCCQTLAKDEATIRKLLEEAEAERERLKEALGEDGDESETVDKDRRTWMTKRVKRTRVIQVTTKEKPPATHRGVGVVGVGVGVEVGVEVEVGVRGWARGAEAQVEARAVAESVREAKVRVEVGPVVERIREAGEDEAQHAVEVKVMGMNHLQFSWFMSGYALAIYGHQYLENGLAPVFAKQVLSTSAWSQIIVGGSNLGELFGAMAVLLTTNHIRMPLPWLRLDAIALNIIWVLPFIHVVRGDVAYAWIAGAVFLPISFGWAAGDVSLSAYIQSTLSKIESRDADVSALGSVMAFLYVLYIVIYAVLSTVLGQWVDKRIGDATGEAAAAIAKEALKYIGGVHFMVLGAVLMLSMFIPKRSFAFNPRDDDFNGYEGKEQLQVLMWRPGRLRFSRVSLPPLDLLNMPSMISDTT
ncbi:hypothetical protein AAF712_004660 [Marasmius tenuissimus]|uniref:CxC2-like cysteine cluster KDZ transposase-associated domain-containing protein n=1 Tax=Marasmius tenuissimus TaxID=585030 RepID=A0ABR3A3V0_9AGAR